MVLSFSLRDSTIEVLIKDIGNASVTRILNSMMSILRFGWFLGVTFLCQ
jgi:hypothetical protein